MVSEVVGRFHRYRIATKLNKEDGEVQVCTLLYSLGKKAEQVYKTFTFSEEDEEDPDDYETVMAKLDNYFVPKVNTIYERARFHQRCQKPGETAEEYIRSLHDLADTCAFADGHPRFFNQLSSGLDVIGIAAEWLISTANTNMFTYEVSPVFILMEEVLLRKMQRIVGWSNGEGDGIFCPGGTISNLYSILVARYHFYPEVKTRGMGVLPQLGIFTSEHSHYSVKKSAAVLGLGTENVVVVKCDERGKMIPAELKSSIVTAQEKGLVPFYVNATAGTTVYGAFDPLDAIADICHRHSLWMHVDVRQHTQTHTQFFLKLLLCPTLLHWLTQPTLPKCQYNYLTYKSFNIHILLKN